MTNEITSIDSLVYNFDTASFSEISKLADEIEKSYSKSKNTLSSVSTLSLELGVLQENIGDDDISKIAYEKLKKRLLDTKNTDFLKKYISRRSKGDDSYNFLFNSWDILRKNEISKLPKKSILPDEHNLTPDFDNLGLLTKESWDSYIKLLSEEDQKQSVKEFSLSSEASTESYIAFFIDANKLHGINKDYGQSTGDSLIEIVAESIRSPFDKRSHNNSMNQDSERRQKKGYAIGDDSIHLLTHLETDPIATRFGGDEFVLVIKGQREDINEYGSELPNMIFNYLEENPITITKNGNKEIIIPTVGIGYSIRDSIDDALIDAEKACFIAKTAGAHSKNMAVSNSSKYNIDGNQLSLVDVYKVLFEHIEKSSKLIAGELHKKLDDDCDVCLFTNENINFDEIIEDYTPTKLKSLLKSTESFNEFSESVKRAYFNTEKDSYNKPIINNDGYAKIEGRPFIAERTFSKIYNRLNATLQSKIISEVEIIKLSKNTIDSIGYHVA